MLSFTASVNSMICVIFKSEKKPETYLFLPKERDYDDLPEALRFLFGSPVFLMELEIHPGRKLARNNTDQVLKDLHEKGFHLQLPPENPLV